MLRFWKRKDTSPVIAREAPGFSATAVSVARNVLMRPERLLLDLPNWLVSMDGTQGAVLLHGAEAELAQAGEHRYRRLFLTRFADVVQHPSAEKLVALSRFIVVEASAEFREALLWDGRCSVPIRFFELITAVQDYLERSSEGKRNRIFRITRDTSGPNSKATGALDQELRTILKEWRSLLDFVACGVDKHARKKRPATPAVRCLAFLQPGAEQITLMFIESQRAKSTTGRKRG